MMLTVFVFFEKKKMSGAHLQDLGAGAHSTRAKTVTFKSRSKRKLLPQENFHLEEIILFLFCFFLFVFHQHKKLDKRQQQQYNIRPAQVEG